MIGMESCIQTNDIDKVFIFRRPFWIEHERKVLAPIVGRHVIALAPERIDGLGLDESVCSDSWNPC